jgi:hypothetical protein
MRKLLLPLLLIGVLATPAVWAQEAGEGGGAKARRKGPRDRRGPADPLMNFKRLSKQLKLDQNQQTQIQPLVEEYAVAVKQIHDSTPQDVRDKRRDITKQMRDARQAGDKEKIKQLNAEMRELRKNDPSAGQIGKLRSELVPRIEAVLREDQKQTLRKIARIGKPGKGGANDPRRLRAAVFQLNLRADQKAELKKIDQEFRDATKGLGKGASPEKRREMNEQYRQEVMKVLDPAQQQQLEEILKQPPPPPGMRGLMRNPKALGMALDTIELRPDQQTNIDALKERYRADLQAAGKDRQARADLHRRFVDDVMKQLDDAQKQKLMEFKPPKGKRGGKKGKGRKGGAEQ